MRHESHVQETSFHAGGKGYNALRALKVGEVVSPLTGRIRVGAPTVYSVQVSRDEHLDPENLHFLNHSCVPNTFLDTEASHVIAIRPIAEGEPLSFFYPSTEWEMGNPFPCACGATACLGTITGASALPAVVLEGYALNAHIRELLAERDATGALVRD
ncbi:SET domain-containing protein-lysine N-methyltransferase [Streptomyces corynorhini]|uniref:SET domain-containing protein n=1 Tax=Streptomyces corynorhini TaxID=2282652 RepID=A0A370B977_9ACTN|nr:SET domain-containing protein-lysine N-methyltransferase [Streptomyces corynorhini]RDG36684.1 SET domain-containing protein [Streptomyces corynorhini]